MNLFVVISAVDGKIVGMLVQLWMSLELLMWLNEYFVIVIEAD